MPPEWIPQVFAESLAVRLAAVKGLAAHVSNGTAGSGDDFWLGGEVTMRDNRLVITTRLRHADGQDPVWTATFWRSVGPIHNLVQDVSSAVVEAVYADLARRALRTSKEK